MSAVVQQPNSKTIFERIIDHEIPANIVYEDDQCLAFHDINPQAPVHVLLVPKKRIPRLELVTPEDGTLLGHLLLVVPKLIAKLGLEEGFRIVINNGRYGCETVPHLHVHILGGRQLGWPPG